MHRNLSHSLVPCFLCFLQPANNPPAPTPPAPPASDFISYFVDQPTFIFIFPPSSITPAACSCCCLLSFIPLFFFFFFHPSVCIHRTGTVSHMASQSLFFTAARSSWKASDETWQVSQPNTVESVKHLDASRLTESTLWRVVQIFCRFKKKKKKMFCASHFEGRQHFWCNRLQCFYADCKNTACFILQTDGSAEIILLPGLWQIQPVAVKILKLTDMSLVTAVGSNFPSTCAERLH